jgi:hypothetical protein
LLLLVARSISRLARSIAQRRFALGFTASWHHRSPLRNAVQRDTGRSAWFQHRLSVAQAFPNSARPRIFDGAAEAKLIALMCSPPPKGRAKWTHAKADWQFTTADARVKLKRLYPSI